jgi:IS5 family transposase
MGGRDGPEWLGTMDRIQWARWTGIPSKDKPLSEAQERRNKRIASPRARVEHVFAGLAQLGGKVLRSIGLARATLHLNWKSAAYNLRFSYLKEAGIVAF